MTLYTRYTLKELAKLFLLILGVLYFLYVLIDYSAHAKVFSQGSVTWKECALYYFDQWTKRCDLLIPIALLVACVKVLVTLNLRNELVAMLASGSTLKRLLRPFFFFALLCMGMLYINFQWIQPSTLAHLQTFEDRFFKDASRSLAVEHLTLSDGSLLLYHHYAPQERCFHDAYLVRKDPRDVIHCEELVEADEGYVGRDVVRIAHDAPTTFHRLPEQAFPHMELDLSPPPPAEQQALTRLAGHLHWRLAHLSDREAENISLLTYKLLIPFTCLLIVLGTAPFCVRFSRTLPVFMIFALSLFGLIAFFTTLNAALILAKHQVFPPLLALLLPFLLPFAMFGWKYAKL